MAESVNNEAQPPATAEGTKKLRKKKLRPTNCLQTNKRIRRKDWYYRNGKYFANKKAFKIYVAAELEKVKKAQSDAQPAAAEGAQKGT